MQRESNPEMDRLILDHLVEKFKITQKRTGIHLSTLVYCLTRSYFETSASSIDPTDEEVMLFALGLGLQEVLTPTTALTPVYEMDGVTFSPDFTLQLKKGLDEYQYAELKTTRASMSGNLESLPETWVEYIKGGCWMRGVQEYELSTLFLMGNYKPPFPMLHSETLRFTKEELEENWNYLIGRRAVYAESVDGGIPPTPKRYCKEWECRYCRYKLVCDSLLTSQGGVLSSL